MFPGPVVSKRHGKRSTQACFASIGAILCLACLLFAFFVPSSSARDSDFELLGVQNVHALSSASPSSAPDRAGAAATSGGMSVYSDDVLSDGGDTDTGRFRTVDERDSRRIPEFVDDGSGIIHEADRYWDDYVDSLDEKVRRGEMGPVEATVKHTYGTVMGFLIDISGLKQVETSAGRLGHDVGWGADRWTITKDSAALAGNMALASTTFLPAAGVLKGGRLARAAEAGTAVRMTRAGTLAADEVATGLKALLRRVAPGGAVTRRNARALFEELEVFGEKYGIKLREAGTIGESTASADVISVNLKAGAPHELAHAVQQMQTRATAFETMAQRLGKPVGALTEAEKAAAYEEFVKPFEAAAYAQHESYAFRASGFGGRGGSRYVSTIEDNIDDFAQAYKSGTVPQARVGVAGRLYGDLPALVGTSQGQIARNGAALNTATINHNRR